MHALLRKSKPRSFSLVALTSSKRGTSTSTITIMVFNVLSVAAVGDGVIDDSKAFKNTAWNAFCSSQTFLQGTTYSFQGTLWNPSHLSGCVISMVRRWDFFSLSLLIVLMTKKSLAFGLDYEKIIITLVAPDGVEAESPKTSKQEWLVFINIKGNVIARGWSYIWQRREMVESSWQAW